MRITIALLVRRTAIEIRKGIYPVKPKDLEYGELTKKYANLPEKYLEDVKKGVFNRTPRGINYQPREWTLDKPSYFGVNRIWSLDGQEEMNEAEETPYVEPLREWFFFKGDRVQILEGKDQGKQGIIEMVIQERNWVLVKGLNADLVPAKDAAGNIFSYNWEERPLLVPHQVSLVDPGDLQPAEVEWAYTEQGEKVRVSKRSGRIIPFSRSKDEAYQYKNRQTYVESDKDTKASDMKSTYQPKLMTFEMEIAQEYGIEDDRVPAKTYWY